MKATDKAHITAKKNFLTEQNIGICDIRLLCRAFKD